MQKKISIYFQHKPLVIGSLSSSNDNPDVVVRGDIVALSLLDKITQFANNTKKDSFFILSDDPDGVFQHIAGHFRYIQAAGALVKGPGDQVLVIRRNGYVDLPKGKMDAGETPGETAVREIYEECGITDLHLIRKLPSTFHTYSLKGDDMLKETHWFLMETTRHQTPVPQAEEQITEARWVGRLELDALLPQTYPSLVGLFRAFLED